MLRLEHGELLSSGYQGVVYKVPAGPAYAGVDYLVVKEAMGTAPVRAFRRWMIRREYSVYRRLEGVAGVPRCFGLHEDRLLLEFVEGHPLKLSAGELEDRERFFASLLEILHGIHRAGVAHSDLKRKENILVTPAGMPCLIDFGSALVRHDGGRPWRNWAFRQACQIDLNAWVKHKYLARYDDVSGADARLYAPTPLERIARPLRRLWRKVTARQYRKARRRAAEQRSDR
jgi:predicted Ser/Thr protein kinase